MGFWSLIRPWLLIWKCSISLKILWEFYQFCPIFLFSGGSLQINFKSRLIDKNHQTTNLLSMFASSWFIQKVEWHQKAVRSRCLSFKTFHWIRGKKYLTHCEIWFINWVIFLALITIIKSFEGGLIQERIYDMTNQNGTPDESQKHKIQRKYKTQDFHK